MALAILATSPIPAPAAGIGDSAHRSATTTETGTIQARLTFTIGRPNEASRRLVYVMFWKPYPPGTEYASKALFFTEEPVADKGYAYMGWFHASGREESWLYIPELRAVRRIVHTHGHHAEAEEGDDPFDASVLQRAEMEPDPVNWGEARPAASDTIAGQTVDVVDRAAARSGSPYVRLRTWLSRPEGLPLRARYERPDGTWKEIDTTWHVVDAAWVWDHVTAHDTRSGVTTTLEVSDVRVHTDVPDRLFTERAMKDGLKRFAR